MNTFEVNNKTKSSRKILVTAGPTIEPIDPIRFLSNYSTGTMGYAIAERFAKKGFEVCLVSGPVQLTPPPGVELVEVQTACDMRDAVMERIVDYDCLVMAAAVCDFRPEDTKDQKIKKKEKLTLELVKTPDILAEVGERKGLIKVGFALETEDSAENGKKKMDAKKLDMIIVNTKSSGTDPFGPGEKDITVIGKDKNVTEFKGVNKRQFAETVVDKVEKLLP
jgi:phosphopantothenoylcysteine decarboxylase/phosphopantothenate--cysteine ligase